MRGPSTNGGSLKTNQGTAQASTIPPPTHVYIHTYLRCRHVPMRGLLHPVRAQAHHLRQRLSIVALRLPPRLPDFGRELRRLGACDGDGGVCY